MNRITQEDLDFIFSRTKGFFKSCKGQGFFITGGTGFFGRWMLESLLEADRRLGLRLRVCVLSRNPERFKRDFPQFNDRQNLKFIKGQISSFVFPPGRFENILHLATETRYALDSINMFDNNVNGTRRALKFASCCSNKRFLFTSSGAVYGLLPKDKDSFREDFSGAPDTMNTDSCYGQSKRISEFLCSHYALKYGIEIKIARCFAFVGPYLPLDANFAVGNFIKDSLKDGLIIVKSDGSARRSYLYASDLAVWLWTILFEGKSLTPYNVGSDKAISVKELAFTVSRQFNPPVKVKILGKGSKQKKTDSYIPDITRVRKELGLTQSVGLDNAILKTIDFYKNFKKEGLACQQ
jgi:dTDP-glucose 4,6-dehydratase